MSAPYKEGQAVWVALSEEVIVGHRLTFDEAMLLNHSLTPTDEVIHYWPDCDEEDLRLARDIRSTTCEACLRRRLAELEEIGTLDHPLNAEDKKRIQEVIGDQI